MRTSATNMRFCLSGTGSKQEKKTGNENRPISSRLGASYRYPCQHETIDRVLSWSSTRTSPPGSAQCIYHWVKKRAWHQTARVVLCVFAGVGFHKRVQFRLARDGVHALSSIGIGDLQTSGCFYKKTRRFNCCYLDARITTKRIDPKGNFSFVQITNRFTRTDINTVDLLSVAVYGVRMASPAFRF